MYHSKWKKSISRSHKYLSLRFIALFGFLFRRDVYPFIKLTFANLQLFFLVHAAYTFPTSLRSLFDTSVNSRTFQSSIRRPYRLRPRNFSSCSVHLSVPIRLRHQFFLIFSASDDLFDFKICRTVSHHSYAKKSSWPYLEHDCVEVSKSTAWNSFLVIH